LGIFLKIINKGISCARKGCSAALFKNTKAATHVKNTVKFRPSAPAVKGGEDAFVSTRKTAVSDVLEGDLYSNDLFSFARKHPLKNASGEISEDGLVLCRMDNYNPVNGIIRTQRDAVVSQDGLHAVRNSIHFSLNSPVENQFADFWSKNKNLYLIPYKNVDNIVGGSAVDIYTKGSVRIPKGTVIVRQNNAVAAGKYRVKDASAIEEFKDLHGVKVVETARTPYQVATSVIKKMGYEVQEGGQYGWGDAISLTFVNFMRKNNKFLAAHSNTPNGKIEQIINHLKMRSMMGKSWECTEDVTRVLPPELLNTTGTVLKAENGKIILKADLKKEYLDMLNYVEKYAKNTGYPIDFDVKKLKQFISTAQTPKDAMQRINKELKLDPIVLTNNIECSESQFFFSSRMLVGSSGKAGQEVDNTIYKYVNGKINSKINDLGSDITETYNKSLIEL